MNKLQTALKTSGGCFPFLTCGDPDLETTAALLRALEAKGAAGAELGIPFSDAAAEAPCRQLAGLRALQNGVRTERVFQMLAEVRRDVTMPIILVTYANVVYSYGTERFIREAKAAGADGLLLSDVPFEEQAEFEVPCRKFDLEWIISAAPAPESRLAELAKNTSGIVSCTGSVQQPSERIRASFAEMQAVLRRENPALLCLSDQEDGGCLADGFVLSTALVSLIERYGREVLAHLDEIMGKAGRVCV